MDIPIFLKPKEDIFNYYYFDKGLTSEDINKLTSKINEYKKDKMEKGNVGGVIDPTYRSSNICWLSRKKFAWLYEKLSDFIHIANDDLFKFQLCGNFEKIQYTEYDSNYRGHYDWHVDLGDEDTSFRKISLSIQLSDPEDYEGGELHFFINRDNIVAPKDKGSVILFPSFMTHRVQPVTKGLRKCLVLWASGPPFM